MVAEKKCQECGGKISGRVDKKFCSDPCRVAYNNRIRSDETNFMRNVNNTLRKNRRILMELNPSGKTRVAREQLSARGFDFSFFTSEYKTREGSVYHYCYEQGYLEIDKDWFLLVVKK